MEKTQEITNQLNEKGFIPLFYHSDIEVCIGIVKACFDGGIRVVEFTDRGEKALENFKKLKIYVNTNLPGMLLGIGSITNKKQAEEFLNAEADFIVAPILDEETGKYCKQENVAWIPGCGTLSEIARAVKIGAEVVKIFPGNVLGSGFVKAVLGPMPQLKLMPTGGVEPTEENLKAWFDAGVFCVGMGSKLISKETMDNRNFHSLTLQVQNLIKLINEIKSSKYLICRKQ